MWEQLAAERTEQLVHKLPDTLRTNDLALIYYEAKVAEEQRRR